jgi:hypothetical protein
VRAVVAQHASVLVCHDAAKSSDIPGNNRYGIERGFCNRSEGLGGRVVWIAKPAIVGTLAAMKILIEVFCYKSVKALNSGREDSRFDLELLRQPLNGIGLLEVTRINPALRRWTPR